MKFYSDTLKSPLVSQAILLFGFALTYLTVPRSQTFVKKVNCFIDHLLFLSYLFFYDRKFILASHNFLNPIQNSLSLPIKLSRVRLHTTSVIASSGLSLQPPIVVFALSVILVTTRTTTAQQHLLIITNSAAERHCSMSLF